MEKWRRRRHLEPSLSPQPNLPLQDFSPTAAVEGSPTKSANSARPGHVRAWPRIVSLSCGAVALHGFVAWYLLQRILTASDLGQCHIQLRNKGYLLQL